jgi:general secretion pathway protein D
MGRGDVRFGLVRGAWSLLLVCLLLVAAVAGHAQPAAPRVYGIELDAAGDERRILVFADGELEPVLDNRDRRTSILVLPGATLDPSAPKQLRGERGAPFGLVTAFESAGGSPEVRVAVQHAPGVTPSLSRRGEQIALIFPKPLPKRAEAAARTMAIRMLDANFRDAVQRIAQFLDLTVVIGDELRGRISIDAPEPVTPIEARALLDSLLLLRGFALLPTPAGVLKVVTLDEANPPWVADIGGRRDEAPLTTLLRLQNIDAALVEQAVRPLVAPTGLLLPLPDDKSLILAGPAHRVRRLVDVIGELDATGPRRVAILRLEWAAAETLEEMIRESFQDVEAWGDARTNRLIVRARPDHVEEVRRFVARVDRPDATAGAIQVLPVHYADVDRVLEILTTLKGGTDPVSGIDQALGAALAGREFAVSVHRPTHALVVQADRITMEWVRDLVAEIDRPPARIEVELTVAEVTLSDSLVLGFDALLPLVEPSSPDDLAAVLIANPSVGSSTGNPLTGGTSLPLFAQITRSPILLPVLDPLTNLPIINPATGEPVVLEIPRGSGVVTAGAVEVRANVLLKPRLSLLSGEEHELFVGDNVPIRIAQADATNPLETRQDIERRDVGLSLRVEPTVGERGLAILTLDLEVSRLSNTGGQDPTVVGPSVSERRLQSTARLHPGQTAVLAFVATPQQQRGEVGTPFLKDIPVFGWLFRRQAEMTLETHLIVLARAIVERPEAEVLSRWLREALHRDAEAAETAEAFPAPRS